MTIQVNVRMDNAIKQQAEELLQGLGLSMSAAINLFARAVIREQGIPFELKHNQFIFTTEESKVIEYHLLKSEADILEGNTVNAKHFVQGKISELENKKRV